MNPRTSTGPGRSALPAWNGPSASRSRSPTTLGRPVRGQGDPGEPAAQVHRPGGRDDRDRGVGPDGSASRGRADLGPDGDRPVGPGGAVYRPNCVDRPGPAHDRPVGGHGVGDRLAGPVELGRHEPDGPAGRDRRLLGGHRDPRDDGPEVVADLAADGLPVGVADGQAERDTGRRRRGPSSASARVVPGNRPGSYEQVADGPRSGPTTTSQVYVSAASGAVVGRLRIEVQVTRADQLDRNRRRDRRRLADRGLGERPRLDGLPGEQLPGPGREPGVPVGPPTAAGTSTAKLRASRCWSGAVVSVRVRVRVRVARRRPGRPGSGAGRGGGWACRPGGRPAWSGRPRR